MRATGYVSAAASIAQLLGVPLIVLCAESAGWRMSFLAMSVYGGLLAIVLTRLPRPEHTVAHEEYGGIRAEMLRMVHVAKERSILYMLVGYALFTCGTFVFLALYSTWLEAQASHFATGHDVSLVLLSGGLGSLVGAIAVGTFGTRLNGARATRSLLCALTAAPTVAVPIFGHSLEAQVAAYGMMCAFRAMLVPIVINGTMASMPPGQRGVANGVLASIFQSGTAIGGAIGVQLYALNATFIANVVTAVAFFSAAIVSFDRLATAPAARR